MQLQILNDPFRIDLYGYSGISGNDDPAKTAYKLMDKMWQVVKSNGLKNKGVNVWVYEPGQRVFAGVELLDIPPPGTGLEQKIIDLPKFARYKHVGPYSLIKQAGNNMKDELKKNGYEVILPYAEIYGHWTAEENKLETDLLMAIR